MSRPAPPPRDDAPNGQDDEESAYSSVVGEIGRALRSLFDLVGFDDDDGLPRTAPGAPPGLDETKGFETPLPGQSALSYIDFSEQTCEEWWDQSVDKLLIAPRPPKGVTRWINIDGLHPRVVQQLQRTYGFHTLAAEDALHTTQRPRVDSYDDHLAVFVRMLRLVDGELVSEQVSLFLCGDTLISLQEEPGDVWDPIRARIRTAGTRVRRHGPDFLLYALIDALVDHTFPVLERYGDLLEGLEARTLERSQRGVLRDIFAIKRELNALRRLIWPLRDVVDKLIHGESPAIQAETRTFLRDVLEHILRLVEITEVQREVASGTVDLYMSLASNRMNEVMKVLTIIATIFIPLSFIAGVYGMNFDPESSPLNMPETRWYYGYPFAVALMLAVAGAMVAFFVRRGWIGRGS